MPRRPDLVEQARSIVNVNALVVAALALGLVSNVLIAALFGLSERVDAFFAAAVVPSLVMALCIDYLGKNFLPVLASAKLVGDACASSVTSSIVTWVALLAALATGALVLLSRPIFGALLPGFDPASLDLVTRYFAIMSPSIVLMAVNTFHEYVWQFEERFTYISMSRAALPGANLLALLLLSPWLHEYCLPIGYLVGHVTVFLLLMRRLPYRYRPHLAMRTGFERRVFGNSAIVMSTGFVARSKSIVLNYLASQLGSGAIAALALASKLTEPLERSAFTGIRMLLFSKTVRLVVAEDRGRLGTLYSTGIRAAFFVLAPLLWWIGINSEPLVRLLFLRGEFTPEMARVVAGVLCALIPSVLFLGVNQLLSNAFYAMNRVAVPAIVMPLGTLLYIGAAVPLSSVLGTQGLAIATTFSAFTVLVAMLVLIGRQVPEIGLLRTTGEMAFYAVLAGVAMLGADGAFGRLDWPPLVIALCALPVGLAAYGATLYMAADRTAVALFGLVRGYLSSLFGTERDGVNADHSNKAPPARKTD